MVAKISTLSTFLFCIIYCILIWTPSVWTPNMSVASSWNSLAFLQFNLFSFLFPPANCFISISLPCDLAHQAKNIYTSQTTGLNPAVKKPPFLLQSFCIHPLRFSFILRVQKTLPLLAICLRPFRKKTSLVEVLFILYIAWRLDLAPSFSICSRHQL